MPSLAPSSTAGSEPTTESALRAMGRGILDLLFPWSCLACGNGAATPLCSTCWDRVAWIHGDACPRCGLPLGTPPARLCGPCLARPPALDRGAALAAYEAHRDSEDPLALWIRGLKYARRRALARPLARLLADRFPFDPREIDVVVPVPLHLDRLRERGFNQALLLAAEPARRFALPLAAGALERVRPTPAQVGLDEAERRRNLKGAFAVRDSRTVQDRRVLLVDDVCTTIATADACARALKDGGASSVTFLAVARTVIH